MAVEDRVSEYTSAASELASLLEDSSAGAVAALALTGEGEDRAAQLRGEASRLREKIRELVGRKGKGNCMLYVLIFFVQEMLFSFVRKLMDANAEVCFLAGAQFASTQVSTHRSKIPNIFC